MRQEYVVAYTHQLASVAGLCRKPHGIRSPLPLRNVALAELGKWSGQRSHRFLRGRMMPQADAERNRKLESFVLAHHVQVKLTHDRYVAVCRRAELPIHVEVVHKVAPAVARAHEAAAHPRESHSGWTAMG